MISLELVQLHFSKAAVGVRALPLLPQCANRRGSNESEKSVRNTFH